MITGAHFLLYSKDHGADRAFFRAVDAGGGWLIFAMPPEEVAIHPASGNTETAQAAHLLLRAELYLMCDDLAETAKSLAAKNVTCSPVTRERWGNLTSVGLPSGGAIGLYQPTHPTALAPI